MNKYGVMSSARFAFWNDVGNVSITAAVACDYSQANSCTQVKVMAGSITSLSSVTHSCKYPLLQNVRLIA